MSCMLFEPSSDDSDDVVSNEVSDDKSNDELEDTGDVGDNKSKSSLLFNITRWLKQLNGFVILFKSSADGF